MADGKAHVLPDELLAEKCRRHSVRRYGPLPRHEQRGFFKGVEQREDQRRDGHASPG
ncbi:hypothetical protein GCM10007925_18840 [Sphingomonas astaxanthinifaciens DSM 22298]|uniref:Transposase n=1 Tax=Sphingomonas astaxanthinifaciens DSM 22298 TaxID=1123267 RepID=A0ABQ5Z845_9SPHN|nr:hypothetical protein GCM10007925_18840 [Sphingomonas astaxanthinifaciens DSM 22298]